MKSIWASVGGVVVVFTGAVWFVDSAQTFESYYETYQKLKETEQISRGWVSRVIPESSHDIREVRRFSGELVTVRFRFQPEDVKKIESSCNDLAHAAPKLGEYQCQLSGRTVIVRLESGGEGQIVSSK